MPNPYDDLMPEDDALPVMRLDLVNVAIGQIVSILGQPDAPLDPEDAVRMLASALDVALLPVPRSLMRRIERLGDLLVDTITGVGRRRPELRQRLIRGMDDRRREFKETVEGWAEFDRLYPCARRQLQTCNDDNYT